MINWLPIIISVFALIIALVTFFISQRSSKINYFGNMISNILSHNIDHPEFNDPVFTNKYPEINQKLKSKYDIYAMMVWNFIGLVSLEYKNKTDICPFIGTIEYWSKLHKNWFNISSKNYYSGLIVSLPSLFDDSGFSFDQGRFPELVKKAMIKGKKLILLNVIKYHLLYPFLCRFSKKYRNAYREYRRRNA